MKARNVVRVSGVLLLCGIVALGYTFLLTQDAKEQLKTSSKSIKERISEIEEKFEEMRGIDMEEDLAEENRRSTEQQWEQLGY